MDIYEILMYAVPILIIAVIVVCCVKKVLHWSDNNHAEITEHSALLVQKSEKEQVFRNHSTGGMGIPVTSTRYYLTFLLNGKKQRFEVPMVNYIKAKEGEEGTLSLKGTRFVKFEKTN